MLAVGLASRSLRLAVSVNGLLAPPLIAIILLVSNDARIMGGARNGVALNVRGGAAALVMTIATGALIWSWVA